MTVCLLHLRSRIAQHHIEDALDQFEQVYLPDAHYALNRGGRSGNYLVVPDRPLSSFHQFLWSSAEGLMLDDLRLVEIGNLFRVEEQGCSDDPTEDSCGEWAPRRNEESLQVEEVRVRTGAQNWLRRHGGGPNAAGQPVGLFFYLQQPLPEQSGWLTRLREALGPACRPHMRDDSSILLTAPSTGLKPHEMFNSKRFAPFLRAPQVHTALCFTLGRGEAHTAGPLHSVMRVAEQTALGPAPTSSEHRGFQPKVVHGGRVGPDPAQVKASIAKLKATRQRT